MLYFDFENLLDLSLLVEVLFDSMAFFASTALTLLYCYLNLVALSYH